jgi:GNAT superfamily N-acetyltransferase
MATPPVSRYPVGMQRDGELIGIRAATADDAEGIARLLEEFGHPVGPADVPVRLVAVNAEGGAVLLAMGESAGAVGLVSVACHRTVHAAGPVAYITALVVAVSARRDGVGRSLVSAAERWARSRGCVRLSVTSAEHRADAHAFYPRCGLPYTGRRYSKSLDGTT